MVNRLIIIEGIPGAGKTTMAENIKKHMDHNGIESKLYLEGDYKHPADYESVACLTAKQYDDLINENVIDDKKIRDYVKKIDNDYLIRYGQLKSDGMYEDNKSIFEVLSNYDIYELPLEKYIALIRSKWEAFASQAQKNNSVYIFECCFLQNPLTTLMAYHNKSEEYIKNHIQAIEEIITPLKPLIIFLDTPDVKDNFDAIKEERSKEWLDAVINYVTGQSYGEEKSLKGYVGLLAFYSHLKDVALNCFDKLAFDKLLLESSKDQWSSNNFLLKDYIDQKY